MAGSWDFWTSPYVYWDLSGSSNDQVASGNYGAESGWQCDFNFGYGRDLLEEEAENEKWCIHVLKILIKKADTEIDELEKDLMSLQSELAWAEHEEWSEICCSALRAKVACIDTSIRSLKSKDMNNIAIQLLMRRESAENIQEILKTLMQKYFPKKYEQNKQAPKVTALNSSADSSIHATGLLDGDICLNKFDSRSIVKEELGGNGGTQGERYTSTILKLQEKKVNGPTTMKVLEALYYPFVL